MPCTPLPVPGLFPTEDQTGNSSSSTKIFRLTQIWHLPWLEQKYDRNSWHLSLLPRLRGGSGG